MVYDIFDPDQTEAIKQNALANQAYASAKNVIYQYLDDNFSPARVEEHPIHNGDVFKIVDYHASDLRALVTNSANLSSDTEVSIDYKLDQCFSTSAINMNREMFVRGLQKHGLLNMVVKYCKNQKD